MYLYLYVTCTLMHKQGQSEFIVTGTLVTAYWIWIILTSNSTQAHLYSCMYDSVHTCISGPMFIPSHKVNNSHSIVLFRMYF